MNKNQKGFYNENGGVLSFVVILVLSMTLLATASMTLAKTQLMVSRFGRQTSNSYHLARSGAEKLVDTMNKEIAKELPRLMEEANQLAHAKLLSEDGVIYELPEDQEIDDPYQGKYVGAEYDDEYKVKLRELIYNHIVENFIDHIDENKYQAFSDVKEDVPIQITSKIYYKETGSTQTIPDDIKPIVNQLATEDEIGISYLEEDEKDAFLVEVMALAEEGSKTSLTKSRVVGTIGLEQFLEDEMILEEYIWDVDEHGDRKRYPETLQAAIISFGDFVIQNGNGATIHGDVNVKGTQKEASTLDYLSGNFSEPDQWGGITVSDGANLEVKGSAFVVSNIQTANSWGKASEKTQITIEGDAIANTIAINDKYYEGHSDNEQPWNNIVKDNIININRNAFIDNDIRIDRYVENAKIHIGESVFGISDGDSNGIQDGMITIVDPNKSSGLFCLGENSVISMARAFIGGQAFINFGDGNGYHRLYESAGEPFQDVYDLEEYQKKDGHSDEYITEFEGIINTDNIKIIDSNNTKPYAYAPARISEQRGESYDAKKGVGFVSSQTEARKLFYAGYNAGTEPTGNWKSELTNESDFTQKILATTINWGHVILNPFAYYTGTNPYKKTYISESTNYANIEGYKGFQGYMLAKRGVFYSELQEIGEGSNNQYQAIERKFEDFVDTSIFDSEQEWSYNNPIYVINGSQTINIEDFLEIPTAIVCIDSNTVIKLKGRGDFNGIIVTPGKVEIINDMVINGTIIAGNECDDQTAPRDAIQKGDYAGVQISAKDVVIEYDPDMLLKIRFMDKFLQRKLYDSLKITNYKDAAVLEGSDQEKMNIIMGEKENRIIKLSPKSVINSQQSGPKFVMKSLRKL